WRHCRNPAGLSRTSGTTGIGTGSGTVETGTIIMAGTVATSAGAPAGMAAAIATGTGITGGATTAAAAGATTGGTIGAVSTGGIIIVADERAGTFRPGRC